jgi:biopolymer transport protein ExbB/TolQ
MSAHSIEQAIFDVAAVLLIPVLVAALASLALVLIEAGRVTMEIAHRRGRSMARLEAAATATRAALDAGDRDRAAAELHEIATSAAMATTVEQIARLWGDEGWDDRSAKALADFDYDSLKRLERTRILVRVGPALGLMGTLIPLAPALSALSSGNTALLAKDLRIAFSVTILGLFIGAVAFAISLVRDRLYAQDLSDLEFVVAALGWPASPAASEDRTPTAVVTTDGSPS